jgi:hypothetical protein
MMCVGGILVTCHFRATGQPYRKLRASLAVLGSDSTAHAMHQVITDGQAQTGSLAHGFGGEKRVEDLVERFWTDATAVVGLIRTGSCWDRSNKASAV